ncbi:Ig domain-containing protein [Tahibacter sp.]|uniref:Ig domain-containing protein n=1 Tax=Tahibacter sp. TaxID=2056211 RepID=UPI0028C4A04B|nr:Ig domain-containing protein [Tahibacter sp.]
MKKCTSLLGLGAALLLSALAPAHATITALDNVPAATLLLPYFEVDAANPTGTRTVLNVGNRAATETLAHVTLWSDRGVPTYNFDVRIDGYGITEIDLSQLFATGTLPASTPGGFATCAATLPPAALNATQLSGLIAAHQGQPSSLLGGQCASTPHGDTLSRGYVTIDVVGSCSTLVPGDAGYFVAGGTGIARNDNVLWGQSSVSNVAQSFAYGDALVHIEASATDAATNGAGDYTFYARRIGTSGADNREGLPTGWEGRYSFTDVLFRTTAQVWRDPGNVAPFACGSPPPAIPSGGILAFDEQEQVSVAGYATRLPLATQSIRLDDPTQTSIPYVRGFVSYNLSLTGDGQTAPNHSFVSHISTSLYGDLAQAAAWPHAKNETFNLPITPIECSDGLDNDGDGLIDFPADPGCRSADDALEAPQCSDGVDNDGDTFIDFPTDPECSTPHDQSEGFIAACDDAVDNDGDGLIDFPADPQCFFPNDNTENFGQCDDGVDNDGDGLIDFPADPGCTAPNDGNETDPQCRDGIDNDGDSLIDFPADSGCTDLNDNSEASPQCSDGIDNDGDGQIDFPADNSCLNAQSNSENTQCSDGFDNDGDSLIDFPADPGCTGFPDTSETNPAQCSDGIDNDADGLIDFPAAPTCTAANDNFEGPDCSDTLDNDFDGLADAADPGCASPADLNELSNAPTRACSDGIDNDGDGFIDFPADTSCASAWDDVEFSPTGVGVTIVVNPPTLPNGTVGQLYSANVSASGGLSPYTFAVSVGALPPGLSLSASGVISGTPTASGLYNFTVTATDANGFTGNRAYPLTINGAVSIVPVPALSTWSLLLLLLVLGSCAGYALRRA